MNWDAIGAVGEIVGALAVVVSLIYLASQIRQSTAEERRQALLATVSNFVQKYEDATATPERAKVFRTGLNDMHALPLDERGQFHSLMVGIAVGFIATWRLNAEQMIVDDDYRAMESTFIGIFRCPGTKQWWAEMRSYFPEDYVRFVDGAVSSPTIVAKPIVDSLMSFRE
ncbi:MAG: hypothetical protein RIC85_00935 [Gammaproteobacteria bacterium]